jgi:hypothetical protein
MIVSTKFCPPIRASSIRPDLSFSKTASLPACTILIILQPLPWTCSIFPHIYRFCKLLPIWLRIEVLKKARHNKEKDIL